MPVRGRHFLDKARELLAGRNKGGSYLKLGLEDWVPQEGMQIVS